MALQLGSIGLRASPLAYAGSVSARLYGRLHRYAVFAVAHGLGVVLALFGAFGGAGGLLVLVASVPLLWAWGAFQGDVALNDQLDEVDRQRWRIGLWLVPWSMTAQAVQNQC